MASFKGRFNLLWVLLICFVGLMQQRAVGVVMIEESLNPRPDGTNYGFGIFAYFYIDANGDTNSFPWSGPLLSVTNKDTGESVPFQVPEAGPYVQVFAISETVPPEILSETFTLTWTNYSEDFEFPVGPFFIVQPQGQSVFVGSNVVLSAQAFHTTGYQWQKDGTNLVEDGHFMGVANATLTISNAQIEDAGDYIVTASNSIPISTPSWDAILGVFKPIQLGLTKSPSDDSYLLQVNNQDGSQFDSNQVSHLTIYTTTNLDLDLSGWDVFTASGVLTNGIYLITFPDDASPSRFWEIGQQP